MTLFSPCFLCVFFVEEKYKRIGFFFSQEISSIQIGEKKGEKESAERIFTRRTWILTK